MVITRDEAVRLALKAGASRVFDGLALGGGATILAGDDDKYFLTGAGIGVTIAQEDVAWMRRRR